MIVIDGSMGEGGGQVLRTALGLSLVSGKAFRLERIRAKRPKPGLRAQHLTCALAAQQVGAASVEGATLSSRELVFVPQDVAAGAYRFDVGTAGSTTLVLQTVLPALMLGCEASSLTLIGGTHNSMAPSADFLEEVFLGQLAKMGPKVSFRMVRPGFYPNGGGQLQVRIQPVEQLKSLELLEQGRLVERQARIYLAGLPLHIAQREQATLQKALGWDEKLFDLRCFDNERGPGNAICVLMRYEQAAEVCSGFGKQGMSAEQVAKAVVRQIKQYHQDAAPVGEHLADQLLIPLALAGGGRFRTGRPSQHTTTNMQVIQMFLDVRFGVEEIGNGVFEISVSNRIEHGSDG